MEKFIEILRKSKKIILLVVIILLVIIIILTISSGRKKKACTNLREQIIASVDKYVNDNNLLPVLNGESVVIELDDIQDKFTIKKKTITGYVTYTKYNDEYIKTVDIDNASFCTTDKFGKESDKYNSKNNVKVNVYYNYRTVESYNSKWSDYIPSNEINTEETNGVLLPLDLESLPSIPPSAVVTEYVKENKTYYSYRDKKWKWYRNDIYYSDYSSTKPKGYTNKDKDTLSYTDESEWSLDYPEEFEYRHIRSKTGYQWYYNDGKEKIYWENGKYSVESPGDEYKSDNETATKMYSYYDEIWRWYNGDTVRGYSSYSSTKLNGYNYKDNSTLIYTDWSKFRDVSYINDENKAYREQQTDTYSRYLIKYDIYSFAILDEPVTLEELEAKLGKSYEEILNDKSIKVDVIFKFQNEA